MEIAVFVIGPNGRMDDEVLDEAEVFFNEDEAEAEAQLTGPNAKVFRAEYSLNEDDFSPN